MKLKIEGGFMFLKKMIQMDYFISIIVVKITYIYVYYNKREFIGKMLFNLFVING